MSSGMRRLWAVLVVSALIGLVLPFAHVAAADGDVTLEIRGSAEKSATTSITIRLPRTVAAVEGRLLFDATVAEIVGLAPVGGGVAFRPEAVTGGTAFGAYGLSATGKAVILRVLVAPLTEGTAQVRVIVDAAADKAGNRLVIRSSRLVASLRVGQVSRLLPAPQATRLPLPVRAAGPARDLSADGLIGIWDLDVVRAGWETARINEAWCGSTIATEADANGDGCVDVVDVQAVVAAQGQRGKPITTPVIEPAPRAPQRPFASVSGMPLDDGAMILAASTGPTFVVDSVLDTPDAVPGDSICADVDGNCTFRAAVTESNWWPGENRIEFNLPGTAPVQIQLDPGFPASLLNDRSGGTFIDGYSQPGAQPNTLEYGTNAIPGVVIRGTRNDPRGPGLRIHSASNTVRGIIFNSSFRSLIIDTPDAHHNLIVGNWMGYDADGSNHDWQSSSGTSRADYQILINGGAHHNAIGTPNLADRNVSGHGRKGIELWGGGTDHTIIQNNLLCTAPDWSTGHCLGGVDLDHGPKYTIIGGTGPNEKNVIGRTNLNGIEMSHGYPGDALWDPNSDEYHINHNQVIGNWVGFRPDGSYHPSYRVGQSNPGTADNGNGINAYDGSNFNLIEGNYVSAVWDGIQTMSYNSTGNVIRNNIIGESPLGEPAPLTRWGIVVRLDTQAHLIEGNTIRNTPFGGIGLTQQDVRFIRLTRNIVTDTSGPAIYLQPDLANPPYGANNLQSAPVITSATTLQVDGTGLNGATVEVYRADRPAGESGLPVQYLGSTVVAGGTWSLPVALTDGDRVTALQIAPNDNTSELSTNVLVTFVAPPPPPEADFDWGQEADSMTVNFTDTSTGAPTSWLWDFGDGTSSTEQSPSKDYAAAGDYVVELTASNAGGDDARTRTVSVTDVEPPPGGFVVADAYSRAVSDGWGNADIGGPYTTQGNSAHFSVSGGTGNMTLPNAGSSRTALLNTVSDTDVDVRVRIETNKVITGGNAFVYAAVRRNGNNEYRPRLRFNANGSISVGASVLLNNSESSLGNFVVVPGLSQTANSFFWLRGEVTGSSPTTIRVKAWADGQPEPAGWQFTATNSAAAVQGAGSVGLRTYLTGGVSNAPVQISFDDYTIGGSAPPPPPPVPIYAEDGFGRTVNDGWGTADVGGVYTLQGNNPAFDVAGGTGMILLQNAGANRSALLNSVSELDVDVTFRVAIDKVATGNSFFVYAVTRRNGNDAYRPKIILRSNGSVSVHAGVLISNSESSVAPAVVVPGLTQSPGGYIWVRAQVTGSSPTTIRIKAWAAGQPEPASWHFTATDSAAAVQVAGGVGLRMYVGSTINNAPVLFSFDDFRVTGLP